MHNPSLKIAAGFLLLTVALCAAVGFVIHSARMVSDVTEADRHIAAQRRASDSLLTALLVTSAESDNAGLAYQDPAYLSRYRLTVGAADSAVVRLRDLTPDSIQRMRLDSIRLLLGLKYESVARLTEILWHEEQRRSPLKHRIRSLRSGDNPVQVEAPVQAAVVEHGEQVVIRQRRKGFFKRLGDAFRKGGKEDTLVVRTTTREHSGDTTRTPVNISDTLADILTTLHQDLSSMAAAGNRRVAGSSSDLKAYNRLLTERIVALMADFGRSQADLIREATAHDQAQRRSGAYRMATMAVVATLLSLLLLIRILRDMRRAERYRRALETAQATTEALMKRREQLLLTISHDIKAPVNTILGYLSLIPESEDPTRHTRLSAIRASARHLLDLVTSLLDYHKLEAGEIRPTLAPTDVVTLMDEITEAYRPMADEKGLSLSFRSEDNAALTPCWRLTDAQRLRQIIDNLVSNALKYTRTGGITLTLKAEAEALRIDVTDTGCGLSPADRDRVFAPFTRVKGSEGQEGTGLGLSLTRSLAKLLGGTLTLESELGRGSTFTLYLPARPVTPPEAVPEVTHDKEAPRRVAVLDDDALQLQLTVAMLHNVLPAGAVITSFDTPDALIDFLAHGEEHPDTVLTDIEMPSLTGFDVLRRIRLIPGCETLPVVAMTSHSLLPATHFTGQGFEAVLFKPFTQNDLRQLPGWDEAPHRPAPGVTETPVTERDTRSTETDTTATQTDVPADDVHPFAPLLSFAMGDTTAERDILTNFAQDCRTHHKRLSEALQAHDTATLTALAHKMLPTFTLLNAPITPTLRALDAARGRTEWLASDTTDCRRILGALDNTLNALQTFLS